MSTLSATSTAQVSAERPWIGLSCFTEDSRDFFHGRDAEIAELTRRIQRKTLTVLFGQSGLGKTSILQAGVVPRLRGAGYCPVYVRMDYSDGAPPPGEQIKQAIARTTEAQGQWTRVGVASAGESLWEFLHHRDDVLRDAAGKPLLPLLIFDQFEEIFTLGQVDDAGRARAALFARELADLVENRPPAELESRLEIDDSAIERFDFGRCDYRVLISLREDYLAHLEGFRRAMPSSQQNRMRLAPMSGAQAMEAVLKPGGRLVNEEVAAAVVRFVAGRAELANAQVEPALLSLILHELNEQRIAQGRATLTPDLLAGSHEAILADFYERSLADQPPGVRRFIEDILLTDSGFRENVAEERVQREFAAAGAAPDALATLVNRRLLRIEERLDLRRVELTHDVLSGVVKASRDLRREREARAASERALVEQQRQAQAARGALRKARAVAAGATLLALAALGAGGVAWFNGQRALRAERAAAENHRLAEKTRTEAENLLSWLLGDLMDSLAPQGELDMLGNLSDHVLKYYAELPPALRGTDTDRNQSVAQQVAGDTAVGLGHEAEGLAMLAEAERRLRRLQSSGDNSEATSIALGLVLASKSSALSSNDLDAATDAARRGIDILRPVATRAGASAKARYALADSLVGLGHRLQAGRDYAGATLQLKEAAGIYEALGGGRGGTDLRASNGLAAAMSWLVRCYRQAGDYDAMRAAGALGRERAQFVLQLQAKNQAALSTLSILLGEVAVGEVNEYQLRTALALRQEQAIVYDRLLMLDPLAVTARFNSGYSAGRLAYLHSEAGRLGDATRVLQGVRRRFVDPGLDSYNLNTAANNLALLIEVLRERGDAQALAAALDEYERMNAKRIAAENTPLMAAVTSCGNAVRRADLLLARAQPAGVPALLDGPVARLRKTAPGSALETSWKLTCIRQAALRRTDALASLGRWSEAEKPLAAARADFGTWPNPARDERENLAQLDLWLAWVQAKQGKLPQARKTLAPALEQFRAIRARSTEDERAISWLAAMLVVDAVADPGARGAHLEEARAMWAGLHEEMRESRGVRQWRAWAQSLAGG
jgi:hypothetical protein